MTAGRALRLAALGALIAGLASCDGPAAEPGSTIRQQASAASAAQPVLAAAESIYARGEYDSALTRLRVALDTAIKYRDTVVQARALTSIGLANWRLGRYDEAERRGEEALQLKRRSGLAADLFRSYNALGLLAHDQGRFGTAISFFNSAEEAARAVNDSVSVAKAIGNRGLPHVGIGDFALAREEFEVLRRVASAAGNRVAEANALSNLAMVEIRAGTPLAAIEPLQSALTLARSAGHFVGEESALGQLGTAYHAMGDPRRALAYLDSALTIARRRGMKREESDDLQLIAAVYSESGEYGRALEYLSRAAAISDELGLKDTGGDIARLQARAFFALGDLERSRARAQTARRLHAEAGATIEQMEDELMIAELSQRLGRAVGVTAATAAARELARQVDAPITRAKLALGLARVASAGGDASGVIRELNGARSELVSTGADVAWEAHALRARALLALGRNNDAVSAGRESIRAIERVRGQFAGGSLRASYTAARADVYADLVVALLRLGKVEEAFAVADAARGRALLEHLSILGARARGATDVAQHEQLLRRIDTLVKRLRVADTTPPRRRSIAERRESNFLAAELTRARQEYEALLERRTPIPGGTPTEMAFLPRAGDVRSVLSPHEMLVQYLATPEELFVFAARAGQLRWFRVPLTEEALATRVRQARELLAGRATSAGPVLRALHELLLAAPRDAGMLEGVRTLIIVPHAALAYLPFAALTDSGGRYLVERLDVLMLPSSASLVALRRRPRDGPASTATLLAPFPDSLPGTRAEAQAIARLLKATRSYTGRQATEQTLREQLARPGLVHVATHGVLVKQNPMFSRLELAGGSARRDNDGRLEVHEIFDLPIQASLVFLSGCETATGGAWSTSYARGEDYATLAAAFLYSGARNVIATLWRIEDLGAATFAEAFYRELASAAPIEALGRAQRAMIRHDKFGSPFYWGAYILAGDGLAATHRVAQIGRLVAVP